MAGATRRTRRPWTPPSRSTGDSSLSTASRHARPRGTRAVRWTCSCDRAPASAIAFCAGDGTGTAVPARTAAGPSAGCGSASTGGSVLAAVGLASLGTDTLHLMSFGEAERPQRSSRERFRRRPRTTATVCVASRTLKRLSRGTRASASCEPGERRITGSRSARRRSAMRSRRGRRVPGPVSGSGRRVLRESLPATSGTSAAHC